MSFLLLNWMRGNWFDLIIFLPFFFFILIASRNDDSINNFFESYENIYILLLLFLGKLMPISCEQKSICEFEYTILIQ